MTEPKHGKSLFLRVTSEDFERLDALVEQIPIANRSSLAREALRIGLDAIESDPAMLVGRSWPTRGGSRAGAGRKPKKKK